jgi:MoxR-like ATPase
MTDSLTNEEREIGSAAMSRLVTVIGSAIRGKRVEITMAVSCMVARGHLLIEDRPGTGKTTLAKSLARSIGGVVTRVQFTPDLLPSDITGVSIYHPASEEFRFRPGPAFSNVLLADEINRASPKTQAALLEVMEERQITTDGVTRSVPSPFMVVATQNPLEYQGTYPLPEVQLDRFAVRLSLGYADRTAEREVLSTGQQDRSTGVPAVMTVEQFERLADLAARVTVAPALVSYVLDLVDATRQHPDLRLGVSTRGALMMLSIARCQALAAGRGFVTPDDIKDLARPVFAHRMSLAAHAEIDGSTPEAIVDHLLNEVPVPRDPAARE